MFWEVVPVMNDPLLSINIKWMGLLGRNLLDLENPLERFTSRWLGSSLDLWGGSLAVL
jgi:hypothetical protein